MRVACLQLDVRRGDVAANLAAAEEGARRARDAGAELVVLPEMWPTSFLEDLPGEAELAASEAAVARLRELSAELELVLAGSAYGRVEGAARPTNRLHVFDRGAELLHYDKVHLFSPTAEPEGFTAGEHPPATVASSVGPLSGAVCYDVRFGPLWRVPYLAGAELVVLPAQWPATRAAHWRALVLGRAAELQAFVIAANRTGSETVGRRGLRLEFPGNSLIAGPDGVPRAEGSGERLLVGEVDPGDARRLRRRVPVRKDERPGLYRGWSAGGQGG